MGDYTDRMEQAEYEISLEDEDYTEKLLDVISSFRDFGDALDIFIENHGYDGDIRDVDQKADFIRRQFQDAEIAPVSKNVIKKWYTEKKRLEKRKLAFQFCFAFRLDLDECGEFFRNVCLQRGFDCHSIEEAVYYYAIRNHLSYPATMELLVQMPKDVKGKIDLEGEVLFTGTIVEEINRVKSKEELISFLQENAAQFGYDHVTAYTYIMRLWDEIHSPGGLAEQERARLFPNGEKRMDGGKEKYSVWNVYLQILGLYDFDDDHTPMFVVDSDRTLKPILKDNKLLHPLAEDSFPDRQGLEAILRGDYKSNELVRKMLILLAFYEFWMKWMIKNQDPCVFAEPDDAGRCFAQINRYLIDAGYSSLYAGNPYDWIFLFSMKDEAPLSAFRYFMRELYIAKESDMHKG